MVTTHDVRQLGLGHQILSLCPDKLLLKGDQLGALRLFDLQLGNLLHDLCPPIAARLDAPLCIPDNLQHGPAPVEPRRVRVLQLAHLRQHDTHLVAEVRHCRVPRLLAPLAQLRCNADALAARRLVSRDEAVAGFDESPETTGEPRLRHGAAQRGEGENAARTAVRAASSR